MTRITLLVAALFSAALAVSAAPAAAQEDAVWLRYPAISPDGATLVFVYRGDLYRVPSAGGTATRLTTHTAHDFMPVWSRDGRWLAFASDRFGNFDVYRMPAGGGEAERLTVHSADEYPYAFMPDGTEVVYGAARLDAVGSRLFPTGSQPELYAVSVDGGRPHQLLTSPAEEVALSADGRLMVYEDRKGQENAWRKHHTSSVARDLWVYDTEAGTHRKLTAFPGEDRDPVLGDDDAAVYYLSEASGTLNVHSMPIAGGRSTQVTYFEEGGPVRFLSRADDGTLAFAHAGYLYTLDPGPARAGEASGRSGAGNPSLAVGSTGSSGLAASGRSGAGNPSPAAGSTGSSGLAASGTGSSGAAGRAAEPRRVRVTIASDAAANSRRVETFSGGAREAVLAPNGKEVAFVYRGDVFVTSVDGATTKQVTTTPEAETGVVFSPDSETLLYASERDGKWGIYEARRTREEERYFFASTVLTEAPVIVNEHQNFVPRFSPDGTRIAYIEDYTNLRVRDVESGDTRTLLTDRHIFGTRPYQHFEWSPDGQWILFDYAVPGLAPGEAGLVRVSGGDPINLTESGFHDASPIWILGGKAMLWLSNRDGLHSMAMSGRDEYDAYAMFFTREAWDRFNLSEEDYALLKEAEKAAKKAEGEEKDDEESSSPEPVELALDEVRDRKARLTIHSSRMGGALVSEDGETLYYLARFEEGLNLWSTKLRTKETKMVVSLDARSAGMMWDSAGKKIFLVSDGGFSLVDPTKGSRERIAVRGEMVVDEDAERAALFERVWRRTRDTFYTDGYHGADWAALGRQYEQYLPGVGDEHGFAELLSEMLGELNVSHSGARYSTRMENADETASLGIFHDYARTEPGVEVVEVMEGGPLDRPGMEIEPGAVIAAIDGVEIGTDVDFAALLNRKAGRNVLLTVRDPGEREPREVVVKPITSREERRLLYDRWVERNRAEVERLSDGRLGYVHVPGMSDRSYRAAFDEVLGMYPNREGLVVDVRWNGGGDLVADLAMFLTGERFLNYTTDDRSTGFEPNFRWTRPSVSIVNEAAYSDGHCYAWSYQHLGIGPLVGQPVPGTCTFAGWEGLQNGVRWGVPGMGVKDVDSGRYLENWQTEPEVPVWNAYEVVSEGQDPQLEAAVRTLLEALE
jgi:Tol biopolymer transport system component